MICLDTNALIWAVEFNSDPAVSDQCKRIRHYLERLRDEQTPVMIPVPVLFEFLCKYPRERHEVHQAARADAFVLFDATPQVASEAAALFQAGNAAAMSSGGQPKQQRKMDLLVAASAIVAGVTEIVSEDRDYSQMTGGRLTWKKVSSLPLPPAGLFDQAE
ncbi:MAG TPA: PIN domain-containing protein [Fimbriiglobus sp.]|jgi:predicted nucleic acid-binding protein|nr:PIN domain-containing protein [Fimbriiglobus sp.]